MELYLQYTNKYVEFFSVLDCFSNVRACLRTLHGSWVQLFP